MFFRQNHLSRGGELSGTCQGEGEGEGTAATLCLLQMLSHGDMAYLGLPRGLARRPLAPRCCRIERCRPWEAAGWE